MHHCGSAQRRPNVISRQSGRFWATSIASFEERFLDFRSCWIVFIHVVWGRPGRLLKFSKREAVKIFLASVSSGIHTVWWSNKERRQCHAWTIAIRYGCLVVRLMSSFHTWWYHLILDSIHRHQSCCTGYWYLLVLVLVRKYTCCQEEVIFCCNWYIPRKKPKLLASYTARQSSSQSATGNSLQQLDKYLDMDDDEECWLSGTETNLLWTSWSIQHFEHLAYLQL